MLHLYLGKRVDMDMVELPHTFIDLYDDSWFDDPLVLEAIADIDLNTTYYGRCRWESPALGVIGAEQLSGGVKTLLVAYYCDKICPIEYMGENCAKYLKILADKKDMYFSMGQYIFPFIEDQKIFMEDWNEVVIAKDLFDQIIDRGYAYAIREGVCY